MDVNYLLTKVSINCVIEKDGKFLLVKQARPKHVKNKWSLPGGKINQGEKFEDAINRELKEETGLRAKKIKHIDIIQESPFKTVKHIFNVEIKKDNNIEFKFNKEEISDVKWFSLQEINRLNSEDKLRGSWVFKAIKMAMN